MLLKSCATGKSPDRFHLLGLKELCLQVSLFGDVHGQAEESIPSLEKQFAGGYLHVHDQAVLPSMGEHAEALGGDGISGSFGERTLEGARLLRCTDVADRQGEELFPRMPIVVDRRFVDREEGQLARVEHVHGVGIAFEEQAILFLALKQLSFGIFLRRDVPEGDDGPGDVALGVAHGRREVLDGEGGAVPAPEDLVPDALRVSILQRAVNRAFFYGIRRAVGPRVVDRLVTGVANDPEIIPPEHPRRDLVLDGDPAHEVDPVDPVRDGVEDQLVLSAQRLERRRPLDEVGGAGDHLSFEQLAVLVVDLAVGLQAQEVSHANAKLGAVHGLVQELLGAGA